MVPRPNHPPELRFFAKVEDESHVKLRRLEVVTYLKKVLRNDGMPCFDLYDDLRFNYEIRSVSSRRSAAKDDLIWHLVFDLEAGMIQHDG